MSSSDHIVDDNCRLDDENRETIMRPLFENRKVVKFDWENRWLKGEEYFYILANMENYMKYMSLEKFGVKRHPESIYIEPINGLMYFVKGTSIGSEFGFPRLGIKKKYKWKKMNFTTDLPKRDPVVSYIVASAVKCEKFFPGSAKDGPCFRMHAVILKRRKNAVFDGCQVNQKCYSYILCHVRKVSFKKGKNDVDVSDSDIGLATSQAILNGDEEVKQVKPTGKRGRPRKHPAAPFETHIQKSKRGRKPNNIKQYDIDQNESSKIKLNVGFEDSDENDTAKLYDDIEENLPLNNMHPIPEVGPLESMLNNFGGDGNKFIPSKPPSFQSPTTFLGMNRSPGPDFKAKNVVLIDNTSPNLNSVSDDNPIQQKLNQIIAQSFNNWNNEPKKRKDTDVDFAKQLYPTLHPALAKNVKSIMSPDYKARSFSINSNGWGIHKPSFDCRGRFSIDDFSEAKVDQLKKMSQDDMRKLSTFHQGESKNQLLEALKKSSNFSISPIGRKNTLLENPVNTLKQSSPLNFPKFSAAFKPFKKRAQSFHISPVNTNLMNESNRNSHGEGVENGDSSLSRKRDMKLGLKKAD
jgi:hypothetical protein